MIRQSGSVLLSSLRACTAIQPLAGRSSGSLPMGDASDKSGVHQEKLNSSLLTNSLSQQRGFAGSAPPTSQAEEPLAHGENSWTKFRAPYGLEQKSSLSAAMYVSIAVFGFSLYFNDLIYHPPRVVTMLGVMMLLMYVRRS